MALHMGVQVFSGDKAVRSPETGITGGCKLPCGSWELNPCLLEKQARALIIKLSFQLPFLIFKIAVFTPPS